MRGNSSILSCRVEHLTPYYPIDMKAFSGLQRILAAHTRRRLANRQLGGSDSAKEYAMVRGRYDLTEFEWKTIRPQLSIKPRGVPRVDDRRLLNSHFFILRNGERTYKETAVNPAHFSKLEIIKSCGQTQ